MKQVLGFAVLAMILSAPAGAQTPMEAMQYYTGSWSCTVANTGEAPQKATAVYALENGLMTETVNVPPQGKMKSAYRASAATTYDAKTHRYVETWLGNQADWSVSNMGAMSGKIERWADTQNSTGKLQHTLVTRTSQNQFDFESYPTLTSTKASFKGSCTRS
ncbi:MAG TPA: hypothetical protein VIX83_01530 [Candidatus Cybelea sp.]